MLINITSKVLSIFVPMQRGGQGVGLSLLLPSYLPLSPLSPSSLLGAARALCAQNFSLFPSLPFFLPFPSSRPFSPSPFLPPPAPSSRSSLPLFSPSRPSSPPPSYPTRPLIYERIVAWGGSIVQSVLIKINCLRFIYRTINQHIYDEWLILEHKVKLHL